MVFSISTDTDTGEKAAHKKFVLDAMNESLMEGANEACIACHTLYLKEFYIKSCIFYVDEKVSKL